MRLGKEGIILWFRSNILEPHMKYIDLRTLIYMVCLLGIHIFSGNSRIQKFQGMKYMISFECPRSLVDCSQHILIQSNKYLWDKHIS